MQRIFHTSSTISKLQNPKKNCKTASLSSSTSQYFELRIANVQLILHGLHSTEYKKSLLASNSTLLQLYEIY